MINLLTVWVHREFSFRTLNGKTLNTTFHEGINQRYLQWLKFRLRFIMLLLLRNRLHNLWFLRFWLELFGCMKVNRVVFLMGFTSRFILMFVMLTILLMKIHFKDCGLFLTFLLIFHGRSVLRLNFLLEWKELLKYIEDIIIGLNFVKN